MDLLPSALHQRLLLTIKTTFRNEWRLIHQKMNGLSIKNLSTLNHCMKNQLSLSLYTADRFPKEQLFYTVPSTLLWKMLTGLPQSLGKGTMTSQSFICTIASNWFFCTASSDPFIHTVSSDMFIFIHTVSRDMFIFIHTVSSDVFTCTTNSDMFICTYSDRFINTPNGDILVMCLSTQHAGHVYPYSKQWHVYLYIQWQVYQYTKRWHTSDVFIHTACRACLSIQQNVYLHISQWLVYLYNKQCHIYPYSK